MPFLKLHVIWTESGGHRADNRMCDADERAGIKRDNRCHQPEIAGGIGETDGQRQPAAKTEPAFVG
jgi:hypothetical protein